MPCYSPLQAFRVRDPSSGELSISFNPNCDDYLHELKLPCGKCIGCKLDYARQWAIRCTHEASLHDKNCFLTLTFNDDHVPHSISKLDWQLFMKRLRKRFPKRLYGQISYFMCGEYGDKFSRPHYHACLFNFDFPDKVFLKKTSNGDSLYSSEILDSLWGFKGHCWIGSVSMESAAYVARYVTKKVNGDFSGSYYRDRLPEFTLASRNPSIGLRWIERYYPDVYNHDSVVMKGVFSRAPRYYDKFYEKNFPNEYLSLKSKREASLIDKCNSSDNSLFRLNTIHEVQLLRQKKITRSFESDLLESDSFAINLYDQHVVDYHNSNIGVL